MDRRTSARALYHDKKYQEALDQLLSDDVSPSEDPDLAYLMGLCYTRMDEYEEAEFFLIQVVDEDTDILRLFQSRLILSYIYNKTGRFSDAERELEKLVEDGYESPQIFSSLGYTLWSQGAVTEGVEQYRKALEAGPENSNALNALGYILADENLNLEEAQDFCNKATLAHPENASYLDSLGWIHHKRGHREKALQYLKKASDLKPKNSTIKDHIKAVEDHDDFF